MLGGDAYGVLPSCVRLKGCTRHFELETQDQIELEINKICNGIVKSNGVNI